MSPRRISVDPDAWVPKETLNREHAARCRAERRVRELTHHEHCLWLIEENARLRRLVARLEQHYDRPYED